MHFFSLRFDGHVFMDDAQPPWRAIAIAIAESVTVSILALMIGIFKCKFLAKSIDKSHR